MPISIGSGVSHVIIPEEDMPEGILTGSSGTLDSAITQLSDGSRFLSVFGTSPSNIVLDGLLTTGTGNDSPVNKIQRLANMRDSRQTVILLVTHGQRTMIHEKVIIEDVQGTIVKNMLVQYHIEMFRESDGAISFSRTPLQGTSSSASPSNVQQRGRAIHKAVTKAKAVSDGEPQGESTQAGWTEAGRAEAAAYNALHKAQQSTPKRTVPAGFPSTVTVQPTPISATGGT